MGTHVVNTLWEARARSDCSLHVGELNCMIPPLFSMVKILVFCTQDSLVMTHGVTMFDTEICFIINYFDIVCEWF